MCWSEAGGRREVTMESAGADRTCRLCTRDLSDAVSIHLYSADSVERGVADRMANVLEVPVEREDGLSAHVCELCNARFNQLVRKLEVHRLDAKKNYEKQAKKAGVYVESKRAVLFTVMFSCYCEIDIKN